MKSESFMTPAFRIIAMSSVPRAHNVLDGRVVDLAAGNNHDELEGRIVGCHEKHLSGRVRARPTRERPSRLLEDFDLGEFANFPLPDFHCLCREARVGTAPCLVDDLVKR
jgi:hypothetical protein